MKALSIRQPWAWLIVHGGKDIENRKWRTKVRGRIYIHAAKGMTRKEYDMALIYFSSLGPSAIVIPPFRELERGGFVGSVEIVDCLSFHTSPWFFGRWGYVLRNPRPMKFIPALGQQRFFEVEL